MTKEHVLRVSGLIEESVVDGPDFRTVVFAQGCPHRCPGCHNPETHPFDGGKDITVSEILKNILKNPMIKGVTFSGGEPFAQAAAFSELGKSVREKGYSVMVYSGYTFEELIAGFTENPDWERLLSVCDILVDGRFLLSEKSLLLKFRGSNNQRIIDVKKSLETGEAVETEL